MSELLAVPIFDLMFCLSDAADLASPALGNHHRRVAYVAMCIAQEMGLTPKEQSELMLAGALHDLGALSLQERVDILRYDFPHPQSHSQRGYELLRHFAPLSTAATVVRYHHQMWEDGAGAEDKGQRVPVGSHIMHVADRACVLVREKEDVLTQRDRIVARIRADSPGRFCPNVVEAFARAAVKESFWLDLVSRTLMNVLYARNGLSTVNLDTAQLDDLTTVFSHLIDFRSRFTATHSSGVAESARALAEKIGFSDRECAHMHIAGCLHDLGKLAVPTEILEKPGPLDETEWAIMHKHTYFTHHVLRSLRGFETIRQWGAYHHEHPDGSGYPFHIQGSDLPLGSRIMAVADTFTAVTEDRPYRKGMTADEVLALLDKMAASQKLDGGIVSMLKRHHAEIDGRRESAQRAARAEYEKSMASDEEEVAALSAS